MLLLFRVLNVLSIVSTVLMGIVKTVKLVTFPLEINVLNAVH